MRYRAKHVGALAVACCLIACTPKAASPDAAQVSTPTQQAATPREITVDDQDMGTAANHFSYTGKWEHVRDRRDGRYDGTSTRSFVPGDSVSIFFYGRRFAIHGIVGPTGGPATLGDGQLHEITFFARTKKMTTVYQSPPLQEGPHSIVVVVGVKPKDVAPTGYVNIDYASIDP